MSQLLDASKARTESMRLKLAPDLLKRLESFSADFGMPTSTLAAFAVADWVNRQEMNRKMTKLAVLEATRQGMKQIEGVELENALKVSLPMIAAEYVKANQSTDHLAAVERPAEQAGV